MQKITVADLFDLKHTLAAPLLALYKWPWEALGGIKTLIVELQKTLPRADYEEIAPGVFAAKDAQIFPSAYLSGPAIIGHGAEIRHCAFLRGSALVGEGAVVGNSTELKNCILFDGSQVPHFNYVGDSILGYKAHMGAGAVTSNFKSDHKNIFVTCDDRRVETGLRKFGAMVGDFAEIGCNSVLNPGTIVGRSAIVYPASCVRGVVPENTIRKHDGTLVPRRMEE